MIILSLKLWMKKLSMRIKNIEQQQRESWEAYAMDDKTVENIAEELFYKLSEFWLEIQK
jgi:hypothetical protein